jgi:hypothetical protein
MPADTEVHISRFAELIAAALVAGHRDEQIRSSWPRHRGVRV